VHGRVNITAGGDLLAQLGPGSYFGEIALISDKPRAATVEAATSCLLMSFSKLNFMKLFAYQTPEAMADFTLKVMQKRSELKHILAHPTGLRLFTKQLESEYSRENVDVRCGAVCSVPCRAAAAAACCLLLRLRCPLRLLPRRASLTLPRRPLSLSRAPLRTLPAVLDRRGSLQNRVCDACDGG
jgi:CRP-like cAMP-binding protein